VELSTLLLARLLTGVGLGAALPNLIALTSEAAGPRFRGRAVSLMYCGVPIGAALAAALGFFLAAAWQTVFWVGGIVPLLLVPLSLRWLPESPVFQRSAQGAAARAPRAGQRYRHAAAVAVLFFTLLVVYMLINWLPMLLVGQGFSASEAAGVMFVLQFGAACGTLLLGALMDKLSPLWMSLLIYSGMLASLLALGTATSLAAMLFSGFVAGLFATGGQSVLYALAPLFYRTEIRATGVGTGGDRSSRRDERPAAGGQNAGVGHRHGWRDGSFRARHFAGRRGGVLADEPPKARRAGLSIFA
jgi:AAHS family 3-hydroxyphenylpropionic acid transporter